MGYVELPKMYKSDYITNKQANMLLLVLINFKSAHLIITENNSFAVLFEKKLMSTETFT